LQGFEVITITARSYSVHISDRRFEWQRIPLARGSKHGPDTSCTFRLNIPQTINQEGNHMNASIPGNALERSLPERGPIRYRNHFRWRIMPPERASEQGFFDHSFENKKKALDYQKRVNRRMELELCASWVVHFWSRRGWRGCRHFGLGKGSPEVGPSRLAVLAVLDVLAGLGILSPCRARCGYTRHQPPVWAEWRLVRFFAVFGGMKAWESSIRSAMFVEDEPWNICQDRGRDARCRAPPSQIPACGLPAPGSS